jgi:hypothetical protein
VGHYFLSNPRKTLTRTVMYVRPALMVVANRGRIWQNWNVWLCWHRSDLLYQKSSFSYQHRLHSARYDINITTIWDVTPCSLVDIHRRFREKCCLYYQASFIWAWRQHVSLKCRSSIYQTSRRHIPWDRYLWSQSRESQIPLTLIQLQPRFPCHPL